MFIECPLCNSLLAVSMEYGRVLRHNGFDGYVLITGNATLVCDCGGEVVITPARRAAIRRQECDRQGSLFED